MNISNVSVKPQLQLQAPEIKYEVVATYPHDCAAYTEGLKFYDGYLYESTGNNASTPSQLRRVELETGDILDHVDLNEEYFAEGLTILNGSLFQLTEDSRVGLIYDVTNLNNPAVEFEYKGWNTAWGLTDDGSYLIMSDGSDQLRLIDPESTQIVGDPISVSANAIPCRYLNELESVKDHIYANIFYSDLIVKINRINGNVIGQIDVSALRPKETVRCVDCVPNGIAFDNASKHLLITGKLWPALFRIRLLS